MITADSATRAPARAMDRHEDACARRRTGGADRYFVCRQRITRTGTTAVFSRRRAGAPHPLDRDETCALPPDTAYRIGEPAAVDSLPQAADGDIDSANIQIAAVMPSALDDILAAQHGAGIEDEKLEQTELLGPQAEQPSRSARALVHSIELDASATQPRRAVRRAQERRTLVTDEWVRIACML